MPFTFACTKGVNACSTFSVPKRFTAMMVSGGVGGETPAACISVQKPPKCVAVRAISLAPAAVVISATIEVTWEPSERKV